MSTEEIHPSDAHLTGYLQRMSESIESINARIARLATTLDINLQNESELNDVLTQNDERPPPVERRKPGAARTGMSPERRKSHLRQELRALLVLRYGVATRYVEQVGVDTTRHILVSAQDKLEREGFKPGAAGVDLRRVFSGH
ncbi:hypothetical protein [Giesbergeria anulus]|uniref:Uncharacterized protein n=1 Tax=Giesbergeria anulus TaxID=180197 RepID=A0A1H9IXK0_9BURK|nr:hypothetical protein [Giesbergeria anulus]SEQ79262.1 hypothetical protein SAMN02982919_01245 [Giesbergeria anulus]